VVGLLSAYNEQADACCSAMTVQSHRREGCRRGESGIEEQARWGSSFGRPHIDYLSSIFGCVSIQKGEALANESPV
jgi:hypothetical protein